jgi:hypothetical protein
VRVSDLPGWAEWAEENRCALGLERVERFGERWVRFASDYDWSALWRPGDFERLWESTQRQG